MPQRASALREVTGLKTLKILTQRNSKLYFAGDKVEISTMYAVLLGAIILALAIYIAFNVFSAKHRNRR